MFGKKFYPELDIFYDEKKITRCFKAIKFPRVDGLVVGEIIRKYWFRGTKMLTST